MKKKLLAQSSLVCISSATADVAMVMKVQKLHFADASNT